MESIRLLQRGNRWEEGQGELTQNEFEDKVRSSRDLKEHIMEGEVVEINNNLTSDLEGRVAGHS